jgi:serine/threonine protein kinase/Tfp pilus assembly protein PilF
MSSTASARSESVSFLARASASQIVVRQLAREIQELRRQGEPAPVRVVLARHPELAKDKSLVIELANEDLCQRSEAGDIPDPEEFARQFPVFQQSVQNMAMAHGWVAEKEPLLDEFREADFPEVGTELMGFSLLRELGRGAFACVYLAAEPELGNRLVAVKVSQQETAEAEILGQLTHRNIVPIHSVKKDATTGFTVVCMPYLGSATLCDVLDRVHAPSGLPISAKAILEASQDGVASEYVEPYRPSPAPILQKGTYVDGILHLGLQLAEALAFIHSLGICHCDLKPSNVLLTPDGQPMLLDFNLSFREQPVDHRLGGTFPYMSPEFLRAMDSKRKGFPSQIDVRSDLFSLGMMLCELLLGDHPLGPIEKKQSFEELRLFLLEKQQKGTRPRWSKNPRVDKRIRRLLDRCLAFRPEDRPQTAAELVAGLRKCLSPPRRLRRWAYLHARLLVAGATLAVVATGLGGYWLTPKEPFSVRLFNKGTELYQRGQYSEAIDCFNQVARLDSQNAEVQLARGRTFQRMGQFDSAGVAYLAALKLRPADGRAKAMYGYCLGRMGLDQDAIGYDTAAIEAEFETAEVYNNRGYSFFMTKRPDEAQEDLTKALQLDPFLQAPHFNLALLAESRVLKDLNQKSACQAGISHIQKALKIGPTRADLYYHGAILYTLASDWDRALAYLEEAIELDLHHGQLEDAAFQPLKEHSRYKKLKALPYRQFEPEPTPNLVDPVRD